MAKVVVKNLSPKVGRGVGRVSERRIKDAEGREKTLRVLDIGSLTFGQDLQRVFGLNVAQARRDNERIIGVADIVPDKR